MFLDIRFDEAIRSAGPQMKLTKNYNESICQKVNVILNPAYRSKIRRIYNKIFNLTPSRRIKSWSKLDSFIEIIEKRGGRGQIIRTMNEETSENEIIFAGFVPDYAISFINSEMFFPVVQLDTRFQTSISGGKLYAMITLTGDRTILPIAAAWAPSESSDNTNLLFEMLEDELTKIQSCHTDEGKGLIKSIEENNITNHLCIFHMLLHSKYKTLFRKLVNAEDSHEYATLKEEIISQCATLRDYLNTDNRWSKVSRFESSAPRDQNLATSGVESFNAFITRNNLKNKEPLIVFQEIYKFGFIALKRITRQTKYLTDSASKWLSYALPISNHLSISQTNLQIGIFEVGKKNKDPSCTVTILPGENPDCTCKFYSDCGFPCVHILAVARKFKIDWCPWIHQRYFPLKYRSMFGEHYKYIDFNQIVSRGNDKPINIQSLKQKQTRIKHPAEV